MSRKFMRTNTCGKLSQLLNIFERWFSHMYSYFVGIDIAKNTHWASCLSSDGEIILEPFSFSNDNSGFQKFISKLESIQNFSKKPKTGDRSVTRFLNFFALFVFHTRTRRAQSVQGEQLPVNVSPRTGFNPIPGAAPCRRRRPRRGTGRRRSSRSRRAPRTAPDRRNPCSANRTDPETDSA